MWNGWVGPVAISMVLVWDFSQVHAGNLVRTLVKYILYPGRTCAAGVLLGPDLDVAPPKACGTGQ